MAENVDCQTVVANCVCITIYRVVLDSVNLLKLFAQTSVDWPSTVSPRGSGAFNGVLIQGLSFGVAQELGRHGSSTKDKPQC